MFLSCLVAYILSADSSCVAAVSASVAVSLLCAVVLLILGSVSLMRACACARLYISHRLCGGGEGQPPAKSPLGYRYAYVFTRRLYVCIEIPWRCLGLYVCVCIYVCLGSHGDVW